jgi:hypothetical protein
VPAGTIDMGGPVPDSAGLPSLPLMTHVVATVHGNSAAITFDAVAGAKDYRVYVLPQKSDIRLAQDGSLDGINNATYRCAGDRASPGIWVDSNHAGFGMAVPDWVAVTTYVDNETVEGYKRTLAGATMGYGFADPTSGAVPIYAVGDPAATADNYGTGIREQQTRAKLYVQDNGTYLAKAWRDDGIAFYAPSSATSTACGSGTPVAVYEKDYTDSGTSHIYFPAGPEATSRKATGTPAFYLCPQQTGAAAPVMRVNYDIVSPGGTYGGEEDHDELVLGQEAFNRARCQASNTGVCATASQVNWSVHWGGITAPTQLIVEALDAGCPFQGLLGAVSIAPTLVNGDDNNGNTSLMNDPISTFAQLQAAAPHGEVFLNGTFDGNPTPHPIARALVTVQPEVRPAMDFASDFANKPETFTESFSGGDPDCGFTTSLQTLAMDISGCYEDHQFTSPTYDVLFFNMQDSRFGVGMTEGELWTDFTADTAGKFRITPKNVKATMSDTTFVHAVMEVTAFSTGRRYPQIMISEQDFMTSQWLLERSSDNLNATNPNSGATLIVQPFDADIGRHVVELELCDHRNWQVNDQCPWFLLEKTDPPSATTLGPNVPHPDMFDRLQDDRSARFDVFASTQKAYVFVDSLPYACVDLAHRNTVSNGKAIVPTPAPPKAGPVTVAWGDVAYHVGQETDYFNAYSLFHLNHLHYESVRHYDYIGFKSGEPAPAWDQTRFPCITQMYQGGNAGTQTPETGN